MAVVLALAVVLVAQQGSQAPDTLVRVSSVTPDRVHDRKQNITISFSNELAVADSIDVPLTAPPVTLEPAIAGEVRWVDKSTLRIFPEQMLA
ncbi:hypothetical protein GF356_05250, partial [candidate division GN15 bacterium]|nr:hypothetical protein [candidate division GN15 bacterium]